MAHETIQVMVKYYLHRTFIGFIFDESTFNSMKVRSMLQNSMHHSYDFLKKFVNEDCLVALLAGFFFAGAAFPFSAALFSTFFSGAFISFISTSLPSVDSLSYTFSVTKIRRQS